MAKAQALILNDTEFKADNVVVKPPTKKKGESKLSTLILYEVPNQERPSMFYLKTGPVYCRFGLGRYEKDGAVGNWKIQLGFRDDNNFSKELPKMILENLPAYAVEHSKVIYEGKQKTLDAIIDSPFYQPCLTQDAKPDSDELYPPKLDVIVRPERDNKDMPNVKVSYSKEEPVTFTSFEDLQKYIPEKTVCDVVLGFNIYFMKNKMGISATAHRIKINKRTKQELPDYCFNDDEPLTSAANADSADDAVEEQEDVANADNADSAEDSSPEDEAVEAEEDDAAEDEDEAEASAADNADSEDEPSPPPSPKAKKAVAKKPVATTKKTTTTKKSTKTK